MAIAAHERHGDAVPSHLSPGARGRYAPPPQLFPVITSVETVSPDGRLLIERDADGAYLIRHRASRRLVARTTDPATLQHLVTTLAGA